MIDPGPTLMSLLSAKPPQHLYHYTSASGIEGIASSKTVWATAAQYLNDAKEFKLALEISRRHLDSAANREADPKKAALIGYLRDQIRRGEDFEVCIFSLSSEGDLLSQWRGYCPPRGGFSIGFDASELKQAVAPQTAFVAPCEYDIDRHERLIREALMPLLTRLPEPVSASDNHIQEAGESVVGFMFSQLLFVAPLIKHPSFQEEREWRLIWMPGRSSTVPLQFHRTGDSFVPYVALSLAFQDRYVSLGEIIIGPMPHQYMALNALSGFLRQCDMSPRVMRFSMTPYRTW